MKSNLPQGGEFNDILKEQYDTSDIVKKRKKMDEEDEGLGKYIESIEAYTERHFDRLRNFSNRNRNT